MNQFTCTLIELHVVLNVCQIYMYIIIIIGNIHTYMHAYQYRAPQLASWGVLITCTCMHACMYICMYVCMYVCICMYVCTVN